MLEEAQDVYTGRRDQALRAEARATTLQATAGIAIGLAFTGAAFLIDPAKVADRHWRIGLTVALGLTLFCLVITAFLANRATTRLLSYWSPSPGDVCARGKLSETDALRERALVLLTYADRNYYFSNFKIKHVKVAGLWFRAALASFAALSIGLMVYATLA